MPESRKWLCITCHHEWQGPFAECPMEDADPGRDHRVKRADADQKVTGADADQKRDDVDSEQKGNPTDDARKMREQTDDGRDTR